ncbi:amino acid kinase family protein [Methylobacterium planeticum]|uniref:Uridylate kinase n=1 Tax=Methylobacterium planeticum TaxID=2615211 RepID=A0A6N6MMM0_9HYPH|nr:uridylate kinase [Methylobacterium planeticum]KAB1072019.1 uridylate kinase [Methylobacterium planeticum]
MTGRDLSVIKVGGSLLADGPRLRAMLADIAGARHAPCILVPGGGPFADAVRTAQAALALEDVFAHRLALDAMGRMAEVFCAVEPGLVRCADLAALSRLAGAGRVPVWDPVALRAGHSAIAETWDVTSDSLALWLATEVGAARCILVKSVPSAHLSPRSADWSALAARGIVDAAFPAFAAAYPGEIVIRGPRGAEPSAGRDAA